MSGETLDEECLSISVNPDLKHILNGSVAKSER